MKRIASFGIILALIVLGCSSAARAEHIKVGISKLLGYPGVPIAIERGYFKAEGLDVEMMYLDSAQPIAVAVASGDVDFGVAGLSAGFYALASQGQLRLLASSGGESAGFHNLVYLASNKAYAAGLTAPKDLAGHTVAITQLGTSLHYSIGLTAEKFGFPMSAVTVRPLQSNTNVIAALAGDTVDAAVMPSSPAMPALEKGSAKLLGWVSEVAPDFSTGSACFTSTKTANEKGDLVRRFLLAYRKGMTDFHNAFVSSDGKPRNSPDADAVLAIMSRFTGIAPAVLMKAVPNVDGEGRISRADVERQIAWYKSQNLLKGNVDAEQLIDSRFALPLVAAR